ncbi:MAG: hypothetical protein GQ546_11025 [Gammaproteobacteria bacterium]|jgi:C_GCAxxG_C_C family probable redox protein|nr:hypothetical protein [Gammaproteobacteria bacterium]
MTEKTKQEFSLSDKAYDRAFSLDIDYGCCPQCVLTAVKETVGYVTDETIQSSHALSGGGALMGDGICGALTGGLLALGAKKGRPANKLHKGRGMANFNAGKKLVERFNDEFGGTSCKYLQEKFSGRTWDMWKADEYNGFSDARGDQCAHATGLVTKWVVDSLTPKRKS